jgi:hypothetical protein
VSLWITLLKVLCTSALGKSEIYNQTYDFDLNGTATIQKFSLVWDLDAKALKGIDVFDGIQKPKRQSIALDAEGIKLDIDLLFRDGDPTKAKEMREKVLEMVDYNFDGHGDLRVLREYPYEPGLKRYVIYLYHPKKKLFEKHQQLTDLINPLPQSQRGLIESEVIVDRAKQVHRSEFYEIQKGNTLVLKYTKEQSIVDPKTNEVEFVVKTKKSSGKQEICRWRRTREGRLQIKSSRNSQCSRYVD